MQKLSTDNARTKNSAGLLQGKHAIIFGAGGSIGAAVAKEFAAQGAEVFLVGRTKSTIEEVMKQITRAGGKAHAAAVDALDERAVNEYMESVAEQSGSLDIVVNHTGPLATNYGNTKLAVDLSIEEFMLPATTILKSNFITARAAARHMVQQHAGVILFVTGSPARGHVPGATAIGSAFGALERLTENLALEVGQFGVRVVCLRTLANTDSRSINDTLDYLTETQKIAKDHGIAQIAHSNWLKQTARTSDTARALVFLASEHARMMTGTVVNATAGATLD